MLYLLLVALCSTHPDCFLPLHCHTMPNLYGPTKRICRDWIGKYQGKSDILLQPRSVSEVAAVLQHCNKRKLAVVPQVFLDMSSLPCRHVPASHSAVSAR